MNMRNLNNDSKFDGLWFLFIVMTYITYEVTKNG